MVDGEIHDEPYIAIMETVLEFLPIVYRSVLVIDGSVIANIVAVVDLEGVVPDVMDTGCEVIDTALGISDARQLCLERSFSFGWTPENLTVSIGYISCSKFND